jgi:hypothetical protein
MNFSAKLACLIGIAFLVVIIASILSLGGVALVYQHKYYPGVRIANVNLTGQSQAAGSQMVAELAKQYLARQVNISIPDLSQPLDSKTNRYPDLTVNASSSSLGLQIESDPALSQAWQVGHQKVSLLHPSSFWQWGKSFFQAIFRDYNQPLPYQINQNTLNVFIHTQILPRAISPIPAKAVLTNGQIKIVPAKSGLNIDQTALNQSLVQVLNNTPDLDTVAIHAPTTLINSPISVAQVQPLVNTWNQLGKVKITFTVAGSGQTFSPTQAQILGWFIPVQDDKGNLALNLQKDVLSLYLKTETNLDQDQALTAASSSLNNLLAASPLPAALNIGVSLAPAILSTVQPGVYSLGKYPGKYIEINLAEQKLYRIDGNTLEKVYEVSSGKWTTPTPTGTFSILDKTPRAYSYEYGLYMPWWEDFLGGAYGIHELPEWPNGYKEGVGHLGHPVSDGCVRLGVGDAEELYNWTVIGTPVIIF